MGKNVECLDIFKKEGETETRRGKNCRNMVIFPYEKHLINRTKNPQMNEKRKKERV